MSADQITVNPPRYLYSHYVLSHEPPYLFNIFSDRNHQSISDQKKKKIPTIPQILTDQFFNIKQTNKQKNNNNDKWENYDNQAKKRQEVPIVISFLHTLASFRDP